MTVFQGDAAVFAEGRDSVNLGYAVMVCVSKGLRGVEVRRLPAARSGGATQATLRNMDVAK